LYAIFGVNFLGLIAPGHGRHRLWWLRLRRWMYARSGLLGKLIIPWPGILAARIGLLVTVRPSLYATGNIIAALME